MKCKIYIASPENKAHQLAFYMARKKSTYPPQDFDAPGSLIIATHRLMKKERRTLLEIWRDTGVPFGWLTAFKRGAIASPSVNRIQYLYEKLSGRKINL